VTAYSTSSYIRTSENTPSTTLVNRARRRPELLRPCLRVAQRSCPQPRLTVVPAVFPVVVMVVVVVMVFVVAAFVCQRWSSK
jgi:hypothetical protein